MTTESSGDRDNTRRVFVTVAGVSLAAAGLYLASRQDYLLVHGILGLFVAVTACVIFVITWNAQRFLGNDYLAVVGTSYLFVGILTALQVIAGMSTGLTSQSGQNAAVQLFLAAGYVQALAFLVAPLVLGHHLDVRRTLPPLAVLSIALLALVVTGTFPTAVDQGGRLTFFAAVSEYVIAWMFAIALALLLWRRRSFEPAVLKLLGFALGATIVAEVAGAVNLRLEPLPAMGRDLLQAAAFWLVCAAYVKAGLVAPRQALLEQLRSREEEIAYLSTTDSLTGLFHYGYLRRCLQEQTARASRYGRELSLLMIDVDDLKGFNARFGHLAGDHMLRKIAGALTEGLRNVDVVARYGGQEFAVVLPETGEEGAAIVAERMRQGIGGTELLGGAGKRKARVTVSVGIATFPDHASTAEELVTGAERALARSKEAGRNRISLAA